MSILIVDDDEGVQQFLRNSAERMNHIRID